MKITPFSPRIPLLVAGAVAVFLNDLEAVPIAGESFTEGVVPVVPDDLDPLDMVTVSGAWTYLGANAIVFDGNSNAGRASMPVGKFDGTVSGAVPPEVGSAPPTLGVASFSITIGAEAIRLTNVTFDFSNATPGGDQRWLAFRTSLDPNIIYSQNGVTRPGFVSANVVLFGPQYANLTNQTVEFFWYAGGPGSGDIDIDNIVINAEVNLTDTDGDDLPDEWEQQIIDADPDDAIATIQEVLPGDDFDTDGSSNLSENVNLTNPINPDTDGDGYLDGVETNDGTFDDLLTDTGTDPLNPDTDGDGLRDGVETNDETYDDILTDTGTDPLDPDTDGDLIPDEYEALNGIQPLVNDANSDPDEDQSTNFNEYNVGTHPRNPDTDADGYLDGVETNNGNFVSVETATGTNPLDPDTDNDLLLDGVETNDGIYKSPADTGTSPLGGNYDGDDFRDGAEVLFHGTSPTDGGSAPVVPRTALFIGGGDGAVTGADAAAIALVRDKFGISKVNYLQATLAVAGDEAGFDLLVLSSTPSSNDLRGKFQDSTVPIINWEEAITDNNADGEFGMSSAILTKSTSTTEIVLTDHPIGEGLPATVVLFPAPGPETTSTTALFPGLASVGNTPGGNPMIFTAEPGDAVDPLAGVFGNVASARRVMLPFTDGTVNSLTIDGFLLFANAIDWATGQLGGPAPLRVTAFTVDRTSQPGNIIATLAFTSDLGKTYTLHTSTDLSTPILNRPDLSDSIMGEEGTTTFVIDFNAFGLPTSDPERYFVVRQND